ncbi:MAG: hypothetical protein QXP36_00200 [Conexivisphaerales archaeon]
MGLNIDNIHRFVIGVLTIILIAVIGFKVYSMYNIYSNMVSLQEQISQALEVKSIQDQIINLQKEYAHIVIDLSDRYYTEPKLFSLWQNISSYVNATSFNIRDTYKTEDGVTYFYGSITAQGDPITVLKKIQDIKPTLIPTGVSYNQQYVQIDFKAPILTNKDKFIITPDLYSQSSYVVVRLVCYAKDPSLIPQGLFISKQGDMYYAGVVLTQDLDIISVQKAAYQYSSQGMIVFIAERRKQQ